MSYNYFLFFFNDTATTEIYTLSLHDALPIWKCYEESSGSAEVRQAEKLLARREAELGLGAFTAPDVKRTTIEGLAQMLRDDYKVNGRRSLRRAETSLTHLLEHFGPARAVTLTG